MIGAIVATIFIIIPSLTTAYNFTLLLRPTGPHPIGTYSTRLTSPLPDPFNTTHLRSFLCHHFFPLTPPSSGSLPSFPPTPLAPPQTLSAIETLYQIPPNTLSSFGRYSQPSSSLPTQYIPDIILTASTLSSTAFHTSLIEDLVSHGFRVTAIEHPYDSVAVVFPDTPDQVTFPASFEYPMEEATQNLYLPTRVADIAFAIEQLNARKVVLVGIGLGGSASVDAARRLPGRVFGVVNIEGYLWDTRETAGRPVLLMEGDEGKDKNWAGLRRSKEKTQRKGEKKGLVWVEVEGVREGGWSDSRFIMEAVGDPEEVMEILTGKMKARRAVGLMREWVRDWVGYVVGKGDGRLVLGEGRVEGWEEVRFK